MPEIKSTFIIASRLKKGLCSCVAFATAKLSCVNIFRHLHGKNMNYAKRKQPGLNGLNVVARGRKVATRRMNKFHCLPAGASH